MKKIEDAVRRLGGVWPSDDADAVYLYRIDDRYIAGFPGGTAPHVCTRTEFEECTKRLRNEPSFDDHPDAKCFVQNPCSDWFKNINTNHVNPGTTGWYSTATTLGFLFVQRGEVIGDWKTTLRMRPEEKKVENKNEWHKRGEFPPAGTVCEVLYDGVWEQTKIIGWDEGLIVITTERDEIHSYEGVSPDYTAFRPLQTERERWVEMARKATFEADEKQNYYEAIYDAGLAKMPEDE